MVGGVNYILRVLLHGGGVVEFSSGTDLDVILLPFHCLVVSDLLV